MTGGGVRWLLLDVGGVLEMVDDAAWPGQFRTRWAAAFGLTDEEFSSRLSDADLPDAARRTGVDDEYWGRSAPHSAPRPRCSRRCEPTSGTRTAAP
ncbi:hypothetical protein [Curtobacterium sp. 24E2]